MGGVAIGSSNESHGAIAKSGTRVRVNSGAGEKKRIRFEPSPWIVPDAWFQLLSESTSLLSHDA